MRERIGVLGAGTWGGALARMLSLMGHEVVLWSHRPEGARALRETRTHPRLGVRLPEELGITSDLSAACQGRSLLVFAVPSPHVRGTAAAVKAYVSPETILVDAAKGLEPETFFTMTRVIREELPQSPRVAALSGPTHAEEVALDLPSAIVAASEDQETAETVQQAFSNNAMRVYTNTDVKGVELCGALKNIMALAAGISDGLGFGDNTRAALITRGITELARLGAAAGCHEKTFYGLAGIGDLIVTATSRHSRNHTAGYLIGQGIPPSQAVAKVGMVVEGINALPAAARLSGRHGVETPIIAAVDGVVRRGDDPRGAVTRLMGRSSKSEFVGWEQP